MNTYKILFKDSTNETIEKETMTEAETYATSINDWYSITLI